MTFMYAINARSSLTKAINWPAVLARLGAAFFHNSHPYPVHHVQYPSAPQMLDIFLPSRTQCSMNVFHFAERGVLLCGESFLPSRSHVEAVRRSKRSKDIFRNI